MIYSPIATGLAPSPAIGDAVVLEGAKYRIRYARSSADLVSAPTTYELAAAGPTWRASKVLSTFTGELYFDRIAHVWRALESDR